MAEIRPEVLKTLRPEETLQKINQGKRRTHSFALDYREYDESFTGSITVHYPSQMEKLQMGIIKTQLLGGIPPIDILTDNIASIVSTLEVVVDSKPSWFDPFSDTLEYEILESVYVEYLNWVNSFRKSSKPVNNEGDSENSASEV